MSIKSLIGFKSLIVKLLVNKHAKISNNIKLSIHLIKLSTSPGQGEMKFLNAAGGAMIGSMTGM